MRCVADQCDLSIDPCGDGVSVNHRVFKSTVGPANERGDIQPVIGPPIEMMNKLVNLDRVKPLVALRALHFVIGNFGNPVDLGQTCFGVGM